VGAEAANAIPVDATVSFDFRLVPGQTPEGVRTKVEDFLRAKGWTVVTDAPDLTARLAHPRIIKLDWGGGYPALRSDMESPAAKAVIACAGRAAGKTDRGAADDGRQRAHQYVRRHLQGARDRPAPSPTTTTTSTPTTRTCACRICGTASRFMQV